MPSLHAADPHADLAIQLLGGFAVRRGGDPIPESAWHRRKAPSVVKLLALTPRHTLPREQVQEMLWPALAPKAAANSLHTALHAARRALAMPGGHEPPWACLSFQGGMLTLTAQGTLYVDAATFAATARAALSTRLPGQLEEAWHLYTGDLLPDDPYEDWTVMPRERLQALWARVGYALALMREAEGAVAAATALVRQLVANDPLDEQAQACLMRLLARGGQRIAALRQYQHLSEALATELGVAPTAPVQALYEQLRRGEEVLPAPPADTGCAEPERDRAPRRGTAPARRNLGGGRGGHGAPPARHL
jgi:DNA-binding SARP family transcriptional activator